ncbi:hypothetical protein BDZ97DRAFT_417636 [Flammula alnicola]|nr:hypothetical protein BDZ97DRAFT_417636 [Flammula alnicola]
MGKRLSGSRCVQSKSSKRNGSNSGKILTFEIMGGQASSEIIQKNGSDTSEFSEALCHLSTESSVDLLIPDSPTDIQMSVASVQELAPSQWPEELQVLAMQYQPGTIERQLVVPLTLTCDGIVYVLNSNVRIHRNYKKIVSDNTESNFFVDTVVDPESGRNGVVCKLVCEDYNTDSGWKTFLKQCDWLTTPS